MRKILLFAITFTTALCTYSQYTGIIDGIEYPIYGTKSGSIQDAVYTPDGTINTYPYITNDSLFITFECLDGQGKTVYVENTRIARTCQNLRISDKAEKHASNPKVYYISIETSNEQCGIYDRYSDGGMATMPFFAIFIYFDSKKAADDFMKRLKA